MEVSRCRTIASRCSSVKSGAASTNCSPALYSRLVMLVATSLRMATIDVLGGHGG
jgi:hypothetical protein